MIKLGTVHITEKTKRLMMEALDAGIIAQGSYLETFESDMARWFGVTHAVAVANGTTADAIMAKAVHIIDGERRNEVIVPALTFIAQINALSYAHLKPVFVDVGADMQIDPSKIEAAITDRTLAIMPVHLLGKPAEMDAICAMAIKHELYVLEDACESLGSRIDGKLTGTFGDAGAFSFFVSHSMTTGEGGMVVTNNDRIAELARSLRNHGRVIREGNPFTFDHVGFSGKINCLEAIVGLGCLDELDDIVAGRHQNMKQLEQRLGVCAITPHAREYVVPHGFPLLLKDAETRNQALAEMPSRFGVECRPIFSSIPTQTGAYAFMGEKPGRYPVAEDIGNRGLYLPCHQALSSQDLDHIAEAARAYV